MDLVDWAARWDPVPQERPCRAWLPAHTATRSLGTGTAGTTRLPRSVVLRLTPWQADDLPLWIPRLLDQQQVRPGDCVTVDLADLPSIHLTGLELLIVVLWRRVGPEGEVLLTGGAPGLRAQLDSVQLTAASCRAAVHGPPSASANTPGPTSSGREPRPASLVPDQRPGAGPAPEPDSGRDARPAAAATPS